MARISKHIFLISGLSDVETAGNQSMKNSLRYLSEFGYKIWVFSFMPKDYPNLQDPTEILYPNVEFHRLPNILSPLIWFGKKVKDFIGRRRGGLPQNRKEISHEMVGTLLREYNSIGHLFYIAFLFFFYLPVELCRVLYYSFKYKPDLVYGVNYQGSVVASLLGRLLRKPIITRFHGVCISEYDLAKLKNRVLLLDQTVGMKVKADAVIMTNDGTKGDRILSLLNVEEDKIHFWMNGLDKDNLTLPNDWKASDFRKELGFEGKKVVAMFSRLATWKRVDRGIYCIQKLVKEHKMTDVILLIGGEGPERDKLEDLAQTLGVKESVRFLGGVPHEEIAKYYAIANIFLSLYDVSNLGNPLLEALYFGLPIVTIDDDSVSHLLENNHNAFLVDAKNLDTDLPLKIETLLRDEVLMKRMGQNGRTTFNEKVLSWENRIRLEDELIKNLLRRRIKQ